MITKNQPYEDMTGRVFGILTVKRSVRTVIFDTYAGKNQRRILWECLCACGNKIAIPRYYLVGKGRPETRTKSCGCTRLKHGYGNDVTPAKGRHPIYQAWINMRSRCYNPRYPGFKNWGGRGIKICDRWSEAKNFIEDMLPTWKRGLTLERTDNNDDYSKGNCRWASKGDQVRNQRRNVLVDTPTGRMTLAEAARKYGKTCRNNIEDRLRRGWPSWEAISAPADKYNKRHVPIVTKLRKRG